MQSGDRPKTPNFHPLLSFIKISEKKREETFVSASPRFSLAHCRLFLLELELKIVVGLLELVVYSLQTWKQLFPSLCTAHSHPCFRILVILIKIKPSAIKALHSLALGNLFCPVSSPGCYHPGAEDSSYRGSLDWHSECLCQVISGYSICLEMLFPFYHLENFNMSVLDKVT